jgi:glycosyltransferase involved in cell wall biosynthesis
VRVVRPGIDLTRFAPTPPPTDIPPTLLMGSAPWTREQFRTKGVDALLAMAQRDPELHLVFLWRGILYEEMMRRVRASGLSDRVEVINQRVDVNAVLARVHAAVILTTEETLIKAYPHSLLEALAVGRPVVVSRSVLMATEIVQRGCGVVIDEVNVTSIQQALEQLFREYPGYRRQALEFDKHQFASEKMLTAYAQIYRGLDSRHSTLI